MNTEWKAPCYVPLDDNYLIQYGIFHKAKTLRDYHARGRHPEWFVKIGGKIFVDAKAYFDSAKKKEV